MLFPVSVREKIKSYFGKQEDKNNDHHRADELSALFQRVSGTDIVSYNVAYPGRDRDLVIDSSCERESQK